MLPPDDLPRSPSGRLPQWVVDEAAGTPGGPTAWRSPDPPMPAATVTSRPRPRRRQAWAATGAFLIATAVGGAWWHTSGASQQVGDLVSALSANPAGLAPAEISAPSAQAVALADAAHLSQEGRDLFYSTEPQILDAAAFAGRCADGPAARPVAAGSMVGCYEQGTNAIIVYAPADPRLQGFTAQTVAHETLHAAWARLSGQEQSALDRFLEAEVATLAPDAEVLEQISASVGSHPQNRATELFAYVGTQVWREGGLAPELEEVYARFIADRPALVATGTASVAMLETMGTDITSAGEALAAQELANAQARAQLAGDRAALDVYRQSYETQAAEVAAMTAERRERLELSWVWWDGTDLPMAPAAQTLATAAGLLARDDVDLPVREATIVSAESAAAAERARIGSLVADVNALQAQLDPATAA